jgi:hypothetical protein
MCNVSTHIIHTQYDMQVMHRSASPSQDSSGDNLCSYHLDMYMYMLSHFVHGTVTTVATNVTAPSVIANQALAHSAGIILSITAPLPRLAVA